MFFPVAGIEVNPLLPVLAGFIAGLLLGQVGLTGMFLTLPYMVSGLGFVNPAVSSTNLVGNLISPLGGVYGFLREKRMAWSLGITAGVGAVLGSVVGTVLRVEVLYEPRLFKVVIGLFMLLLAGHMLYSTTERAIARREKDRELKEKFERRVDALKSKDGKGRLVSGLDENAVIKTLSASPKKVTFQFWGETYEFNPMKIIIVGFMIGVVASMIGVGGAFLLVPYITGFIQIPIYIVTGATILYTFITSVSGLISYYTLIPVLTDRPAVSPDWFLGLLLGLGGLAGGYLSARVQKYMPDKALKYILGGIVGFWGLLYVLGYFVELPFRV